MTKLNTIVLTLISLIFLMASSACVCTDSDGGDCGGAETCHCEFGSEDDKDRDDERSERENGNNPNPDNGGEVVPPAPAPAPSLKLEDALGGGVKLWNASPDGTISVCGVLDESRKLRVTSTLGQSCGDAAPMLVFRRNGDTLDINARTTPIVDIVGGRGGNVSQTQVTGAPFGESRVNLVVWQNGGADFAAEITIEYVYRPANPEGAPAGLFLYLYGHHF